MNQTEANPRNWIQPLGYRFCLEAVRTAVLLAMPFRCFGQRHYPTEGGGLLCANHQSHFDSALIGVTCRRHLNFLARKSLYHFKPFGALIGFLDAIPLDREGIGLSGIKETIRRCRRGELVLLFPEGSRCHDGEVGPLMPGVVSLAKRTRVPLIPVGVDGAFQAWPRHQTWPRLGSIVVQVGAPILPQQYEPMSEQQLLTLLHDRINDCVRIARARRTKANRLV